MKCFIKLFFVLALSLLSFNVFANDYFFDDSTDLENPLFEADGLYLDFSLWKSYFEWNQYLNESSLLIKKSMFPLKENDTSNSNRSVSGENKTEDVEIFESICLFGEFLVSAVIPDYEYISDYFENGDQFNSAVY